MNEQELDDLAWELHQAEEQLALSERAPHEGRVTDETQHLQRLRDLRQRVDHLREEFRAGKAYLEQMET